MAMAAHVLEDRVVAERCEQWLWDWLEHNPPGRGWNWTSALEAGLRLVQLTWMDALLAGRFEPGVGEEAWSALMSRLLPAHAHYVWRHQSFGSSANNHLLGELAGLIVATVRWPRLAQWGAPIEILKGKLEREVLAQFAEDGGNREQALNYHLFAFELCWQARMALQAAGRKLVAGGGRSAGDGREVLLECPGRTRPLGLRRLGQRVCAARLCPGKDGDPGMAGVVRPDPAKRSVGLLAGGPAGIAGVEPGQTGAHDRGGRLVDLPDERDRGL